MILIADSGSTKTHWRLVDNNNVIHSYATQGINPYYQNKDEIIKIINTELLPQISVLINSIHIYFYGAGCSSATKNKVVSEVLLTCFPHSVIEVAEDILGAARALCGNNQGIAGILGTGSNTVFYDGTKIINRIGGLGYILGDEGSGAHIGKTFLQAYFNNELPESVVEKFHSHFKMGKGDILDAIYNKPLPSRFLASFSVFIHANISEKHLYELVSECFNGFFDKNVCKHSQYKNIPFNCVGSIAANYSAIIKNVAAKKGITIGKIIQNPIDDMVLYHLEKTSGK